HGGRLRRRDRGRPRGPRVRSAVHDQGAREGHGPRPHHRARRRGGARGHHRRLQPAGGGHHGDGPTAGGDARGGHACLGWPRMPRILVVDDDHETCRFMDELLRAPEREIEVAYTPEEALALARRGAFDLVVSDINLNAELSGLDLLRAFKGADPRLEVVLISGFGALETAIEAVRAGAF